MVKIEEVLEAAEREADLAAEEYQKACAARGVALARVRAARKDLRIWRYAAKMKRGKNAE